MVDTVYDKIEDVAIDGKKNKEPCILTEDKLYATDIFRMYCFKVRARSRLSPPHAVTRSRRRSVAELR